MWKKRQGRGLGSQRTPCGAAASARVWLASEAKWKPPCLLAGASLAQPRAAKLAAKHSLSNKKQNYKQTTAAHRLMVELAESA